MAHSCADFTKAPRRELGTFRVRETFLLGGVRHKITKKPKGSDYVTTLCLWNGSVQDIPKKKVVTPYVGAAA